jgi:hypothetical protein
MCRASVRSRSARCWLPCPLTPRSGVSTEDTQGLGHLGTP